MLFHQFRCSFPNLLLKIHGWKEGDMEEGGPKAQTPRCRTVCPGDAGNPAV